MATRATITVMVPEEYVGKTIVFDKNKLHTIAGHLQKINGKFTAVPHECKEREPMKITGKYITIYNHSDGYPSSLGEILTKYYSDIDGLLNLIAGGFISGIYENYYDSFIDNDALEPYTAYQTEQNPGLEQAWAYLWNNGKWYVTTWEFFQGTQWRLLDKQLQKADPDEA